MFFLCFVIGKVFILLLSAVLMMTLFGGGRMRKWVDLLEVRVSGLIGIVRAVLLRMNRNHRTFLMKGKEVWKGEVP